MLNEPEPRRDQHVGQHLLGQHVVGQRVVVRRLLRGETGPSGGPALTDVLGTCLSWDGTTCVVQPETGPAVSIAIADIVSGKPVPPRPSPRHRVTPLEAQVRALALWPDLVTRPLGDWVLRSSLASSARRANSVLAMASALDPVAAYDAVVAFYDGLGQRPIAAVLPDSAEDELFRGRGWVLESHDADTVFQLAGVASALRSLRGARVLDAAVALEGDESVVTARIEVEGRAVAGGVAAYSRDWVGFRGIEVSASHRGQGLGLRVMAELLDWGAERGATTAYLQMLGDNAPARHLYEGLGFTDHHAYRYLAAPLA